MTYDIDDASVRIADKERAHAPRLIPRTSPDDVRSPAIMPRSPGHLKELRAPFEGACITPTTLALRPLLDKRAASS